MIQTVFYGECSCQHGAAFRKMVIRKLIIGPIDASVSIGKPSKDTKQKRRSHERSKSRELQTNEATKQVTDVSAVATTRDSENSQRQDKAVQEIEDDNSSIRQDEGV